MKSYKASIAIFSKKIEYPDNSTCPSTPAEVFEAVERVIKTKQPEILKLRNGIYVIQYSSSGPFVADENINTNNWLPVFIMRLESWRSGGIKQEEFDHFKEK